MQELNEVIVIVDVRGIHDRRGGKLANAHSTFSTPTDHKTPTSMLSWSHISISIARPGRKVRPSLTAAYHAHP